MTLSKTEVMELLRVAENARGNAYAPYSNFRVGAAVKGGSGAIYAGCNVENASYGLTICAERAAICAAVSAGETRVEIVAIVGGDEKPARPCGACRQFIAEFSTKEEPTIIVAANPSLDYDVFTVDDYLPMRFAL